MTGERGAQRVSARLRCLRDSVGTLKKKCDEIGYDFRLIGVWGDPYSKNSQSPIELFLNKMFLNILVINW